MVKLKTLKVKIEPVHKAIDDENAKYWLPAKANELEVASQPNFYSFFVWEPFLSIKCIKHIGCNFGVH